MASKKSIKTNRKDFEAIAIPHMTYIYRRAYQLAGNAAQAEDLTQDTFSMALHKFHQLKEADKAKAWLATILRNLFYRSLEKNRNKHFMNLDDLDYMLSDTPDNQMESWQWEFSDVVQRQLDRLDEKYRTPLMMAVLDDYSYDEIAEELEIPVGTVMSRIHRGKSFLKRELGRKNGGADSLEEFYAV